MSGRDGLVGVRRQDTGPVLEVNSDQNMRSLVRHIKKQRIYLELNIKPQIHV